MGLFGRSNRNKRKGRTVRTVGGFRQGKPSDRFSLQHKVAGNPGDTYNETWRDSADYGPQNTKYTMSRYGLGSKDSDYEQRTGKRGITNMQDKTNMSQYRKDKIENYADIKDSKRLKKLSDREQKLEGIGGKELTKRQRRRLGKDMRKGQSGNRKFYKMQSRALAKQGRQDRRAKKRAARSKRKATT